MERFERYWVSLNTDELTRRVEYLIEEDVGGKSVLPDSPVRRRQGRQRRRGGLHGREVIDLMSD